MGHHKLGQSSSSNLLKGHDSSSTNMKTLPMYGDQKNDPAWYKSLKKNLK